MSLARCQPDGRLGTRQERCAQLGVSSSSFVPNLSGFEWNSLFEVWKERQNPGFECSNEHPCSRTRRMEYYLLRSYTTCIVSITKQSGVRCPCHQALRRCPKRLPDAWSEGPSDLLKGYLDAVPRSMRGYQTVNLNPVSVFKSKIKWLLHYWPS